MGVLGELKKIFSAERVAEAESVTTQVARHALKEMNGRWGEDDFICVSDFLNVLEEIVGESAIGRILMGGDWARVGASTCIFDKVTAGETPFFYKLADEVPAPKGKLIRMEDCFVPVRTLVDRGLYLLEDAQGSTLASFYAAALDRLRITDRGILEAVGMVYEDGRNAARFTPDIAPVRDGEPIVGALYIRPHHRLKLALP